MNKTDLAARIQDTAAKLKEATSAKAEAASAVLDAKTKLTQAEMGAVLAGLPGKNELERKAHLAETVREQSEALGWAELGKAEADAAYDLARLDWEAAKQLVAIFTSTSI